MSVNNNLNIIPLHLTRSIVVQKAVNSNIKSPVFIKTGVRNIITVQPIERNARNSPHVVRSHFQNYLKTEYMYSLDWVHPVSKDIYSHDSIKNVIAQYKHLSPSNYKALWALWTSSTNREALASLFSYSASTIKRRWDEGVDAILFLLIWPELNIKDLKIHPNA